MQIYTQKLFEVVAGLPVCCRRAASRLSPGCQYPCHREDSVVDSEKNSVAGIDHQFDVVSKCVAGLVCRRVGKSIEW